MPTHPEPGPAGDTSGEQTAQAKGQAEQPLAREESLKVTRVFEQPADAIGFYCEYAQILGTGQEVTLQFYENIPGPPGPGGKVQTMRSRLRATIVLSPVHAGNMGRLLVAQTERQASRGGEKQ